MASKGISPRTFKRHKTLPHPRDNEIDTHSSILSSKLRTLDIDAGVSSTPGSPTSSPPTLKHSARRIIGAPDLPPTPPSHSRQSCSGHPTASIVALPSATISGPSTPPNPQSPPTPDVTPPKASWRPVALRPPSDRYPSSRAESFRTARESMYSSDEDELSTVRPVLPSARPSATGTRQISANPSKARVVGLGLGLETDERASTPRVDISSPENVMNELGLFDGEWASSPGEPSEVEREWDHNLMRNVIVRRRANRKTYVYDDSPLDREVLEDNSVSPTNATQLLKRHPAQPGNTIRSKKEGLQTPSGRLPKPMAWPSVASQPEFPSTSDLGRLSNLSTRSGSSATIEAIVIDVPPQRKRTLRHTKKHFGLREFSSSSSTQSQRIDQMDSNKSQSRLTHDTYQVPDRRHRSLGSNFTVSTASSARSRREIWESGSIPVVVVPERGSSAKSVQTPSLRSTSSRRTKRSTSLTNQIPLSQPSRFPDTGRVELPRKAKRTASASAGSSAGSQRTIDYPPQVPMRSSSLSAPTSRNTSRAGSLTAASLKAHDLSQAMDPPAPRATQEVRSIASPQTHHTLEAAVDHNGDPFFGNRLSAQVTPFSQFSYGTTGTTAEIAEAMAVSLYPHHNTSVLVVQHVVQPNSSASPNPLAIEMAVEPEVAVASAVTEGPYTPPTQHIPALDEIDSPLRNPRSPPQPPAIQFIPPTPSGLTPNAENDKQLGHESAPPSPSDSKPKRGLSLVRRALSHGRNSESIIARTFSLKRHGMVDEGTQTSKGNVNVNTLQPSGSDQPTDDSKLHPFWRPSRFWDDLEDDDDDSRGNGCSSKDRCPGVEKRPQPPKRSLSDSLKRTFAILPMQDEPYYDSYRTERRIVRRTRSGNLRVVNKTGSSESLHRRSVSDVGPGKAMREVSGNEWRTRGAKGSLTAGWRGLGRRLSEKRREKRTEKMRQMISGPKDAVDGVDNILKGGQQQHLQMQPRDMERDYGIGGQL
ncbi:MAG: hypothetical protein M1818_002709 [Claussenomyces sp. TS43310]|nr:MAG: hypothetical protein M1818_002709 [Claussenomyces sp. TS43310]